MSIVGVLALGALAGLNPWLVLLIVAGLATFTGRAPLVEPAASLLGTPLVMLLAVLLGVEIVASKVLGTAVPAERVTLVAAATVGALLPLLMPAGVASHGLWAGVAGAMLALAIRLARQRLTAPLDRTLHPFGHVALGMASDVLAGSLAAAIFAVQL